VSRAVRRADCLGKDREEMAEADWAHGLTAMRRFVTRECDARVVMGGRRAGFRGRMPGVLEEALIALEARRPLYVLGGFGGCAGDVAEWLGLRGPSQAVTSGDAAPEVPEAFVRFSASDLHNGLTVDENRALASTAHIDQAVTLVLRGLARVVPGERP
jgi:hypothetical protein